MGNLDIPPQQWLKEQFECEYCAECGGDVEDHDAVPFLGNWFAFCKTKEITVTNFPVWDQEKCGGCNKPQDEESKKNKEPFYKLDCTDLICDYQGCHECMPLGQGTRCGSCVDPETGE